MQKFMQRLVRGEVGLVSWKPRWQTPLTALRDDLADLMELPHWLLPPLSLNTNIVPLLLGPPSRTWATSWRIPVVGDWNEHFKLGF